MIRRAKGLEVIKIIFIIDFNTFGSNMFLIMKIMGFENVALTKTIHIYMIKGLNA
jgi:hypothetical protein